MSTNMQGQGRRQGPHAPIATIELPPEERLGRATRRLAEIVGGGNSSPEAVTAARAAVEREQAHVAELARLFVLPHDEAVAERPAIKEALDAAHARGKAAWAAFDTAHEARLAADRALGEAEVAYTSAVLVATTALENAQAEGLDGDAQTAADARCEEAQAEMRRIGAARAEAKAQARRAFEEARKAHEEAGKVGVKTDWEIRRLTERLHATPKPEPQRAQRDDRRGGSVRRPVRFEPRGAPVGQGLGGLANRDRRKREAAEQRARDADAAARRTQREAAEDAGHEGPTNGVVQSSSGAMVHVG